MYNITYFLKNLQGVTYGNCMFVIVGYSRTILTSPDGMEWTNKAFGSFDDYTDIIYANGMFVIVGNSGIIVTSVDGNT
jgi:hypothetical protein